MNNLSTVQYHEVIRILHCLAQESLEPNGAAVVEKWAHRVHSEMREMEDVIVMYKTITDIQEKLLKADRRRQR